MEDKETIYQFLKSKINWRFCRDINFILESYEDTMKADFYVYLGTYRLCTNLDFHIGESDTNFDGRTIHFCHYTYKSSGIKYCINIRDMNNNTDIGAKEEQHIVELLKKKYDIIQFENHIMARTLLKLQD